MRITSPIRVGAIFGPGRQIRPVWFDWQQRKHTITEVAYRVGFSDSNYFARQFRSVMEMSPREYRRRMAN